MRLEALLSLCSSVARGATSAFSRFSGRYREVRQAVQGRLRPFRGSRGKEGYVTSDIPFAAIAAGRNRLGLALAEIGVWRPLAAILAYAAAFYLHGRLGPPLT